VLFRVRELSWKWAAAGPLEKCVTEAGPPVYLPLSTWKVPGKVLRYINVPLRRGKQGFCASQPTLKFGVATQYDADMNSKEVSEAEKVIG
jgi:hypothetical protein